MVTASLFLVLALVSYTVVAQPGEKGLTSPPACLNPLETSETSTKSVYEWIPLDEEILLPTSNEDPVEIGLSYILQKLNLQSNKFKVMTNFTDYSGTTHMYGVPLHKGLPIGNLNAAAHVKNSRTFFYSATIKNNPRLTKRSPTTPDSTFKKSYKEAVKAAVDCLGVPFYPDIAPVMESHWMRDGSIIPVWGFQLKNNPITRWFEVKVNAIISDIVSMEDFKREFTYTAIELPNENPRNGFSTILSPENFQASPNGWTDGFELKGNNAEAKYKKYKTFKTTTKGMLSGAFDPLLPPQTPKNIVAGAANAFYAGWKLPTEQFQQGRDSALDNTILTHELTHGLSSRLTGGALEIMCMTKIEPLGLSEGYSDMMALIFTAKPEDTRNTEKVIGEYVKGNSRGMRKYTYTTNMRANPLTYKYAIGEKHRNRLGEIWATMLLEVYWNFVDAYGFSTNLYDAKQKRGNIMFLQLFVGTLMLQPCNPTLYSAYDAMIAADYAYYGGINKHLIIKGFTKRGLGSIL
ncbi:hypothetical protein BSLG_010827 [Batrachochytrium salamandrivorans]|nr:hypothetical protein BSLG_010827 [Batrachochytrium salamandrivorans]